MTAVPKPALAAGIAHFADSAENPFAGVTDVDALPFGTPDPEITARIEAPEAQAAKLAALKAHATQIPPDSWLHSLATGFGGKHPAAEHYVLAAGPRGPGSGPYQWEDDLFAGIHVEDDPRFDPARLTPQESASDTPSKD